MKSIIREVEDRLRAGEYKMTSRRKVILKVLLESRGEHLSAEEVFNLVKEKAPDVGLATVYRTLELFSEYGLVKGIDFGDGRKRYEFDDEEPDSHSHHHLVCLKCGRIFEINVDLLESLESRVVEELGFKVLNHQLKITGYCRECRDKNVETGR